MFTFQNAFFFFFLLCDCDMNLKLSAMLIQWFALLTRNRRVGGSSPTRYICPRQGILLTVVSLDPGVVKWVPAGIYSLFAMCTYNVSFR